MQALRSVPGGGTFVTLGYASGEIPKIPLNLVLLKGLTIKGRAGHRANFVQVLVH